MTMATNHNNNNNNNNNNCITEDNCNGHSSQQIHKTLNDNLFNQNEFNLLVKKERSFTQHPIATYYSQPIIHYGKVLTNNIKDNNEYVLTKNDSSSKRRGGCVKGLNYNYNQQLLHNNRQSSIDKKKHQYQITSMHFEFKSERNDVNKNIDDIQLCSLVKVDDDSSSLNIKCTPIVKHHESHIGNDININDLIDESKIKMYNSPLLSYQKQFIQKNMKLNSETISNEASSHVINNTTYSSKQRSSIPTSQLYFESNNSHKKKNNKLCGTVNIITKLKKAHHTISSFNNKAQTPHYRSSFTSKTKKVIQFKLSNFILNQTGKNNNNNNSIRKISLDAICRKTRLTQQRIKNYKYVSLNNNTNNNNYKTIQTTSSNNTTLSHRPLTTYVHSSHKTTIHTTPKIKELKCNNNKSSQNEFFYKHSAIYNTLLTN